jgi:hypothetical protein
MHLIHSRFHGRGRKADLRPLLLPAVLWGLLVSPVSSFGAETAKPAPQCVLQVEKEAKVIVLTDLDAPPPLSPMAYPLTELGAVKPGDLVRILRGDGVTVEITQKGDPACLKQVPKGDPHAHHRKNMKP